MQCFDDQAKMGDALNTEKSIAQKYNHYAGECSTKARRDKLLGILDEEHDLQYQVFSAMEKRGWYTPKATNVKKQQQACRQFEQKAQQL